MKIGKAACAAMLLLSCLPASAQSWDTSGNGLLQGTYYFREVIWLVSNDAYGDLSRALAIYGNISFDGSGHYTISNTQVFDSNVGAAQSYSTTGTYSISASGYGFLSNPLSSGDTVYGLVSQGIFVASTTEGGFNDLFIAAPLASPAPTNASFKGSYTLMDFDLPTGSPADTRDSQLTLNPDGNGNLGTVSATGHIAGRGSSVVTQNISAVKYFFSNGGANVSFGGALTTSNLIAGTKYLYFSPDGNFVFGGSPTGYDFIVGVKQGGTSPNFGGLYYQAGAYQDETSLASNGYGDLNSYYGALKANAGVVLGHQRLLSGFSSTAEDYTYLGGYTANADGSADDSFYHYVYGPAAGLRIGVGTGPILGLNVAVQSGGFSGSGVFLDPTGVTNAASSALFTSGIAPGELLTLYGTNLAPSSLIGSTFPSKLGGVSVTINGRIAPVYAVSPTQISVVTPFATSETVASIQVNNNGVLSNVVSTFVNTTAPGVFTTPAGGIGYAAALHADFSLVTPANPAHAGETISVFLTGLGAVTPTVADGSAGPTNPLSLTASTISILVNSVAATTTFVGLAPGLVGLYQVNVAIPAGTLTGSAYLDVLGPDSYNAQAVIPIA